MFSLRRRSTDPQIGQESLFYRSSQPSTSWITTAGAILDASALYSSSVDLRDVPWLNLCFQVGSRTLSDIATDVGIPLGSALAPGVSMHVTRAEYDAACEQLSSAGVRLKADRDESWRAFVSMRSQYDLALIALAKLVYAPEAPWSEVCSMPWPTSHVPLFGETYCLFALGSHQ